MTYPLGEGEDIEPLAELIPPAFSTPPSLFSTTFWKRASEDLLVFRRPVTPEAQLWLESFIGSAGERRRRDRSAFCRSADFVLRFTSRIVSSCRERHTRPPCTGSAHPRAVFWLVSVRCTRKGFHNEPLLQRSMAPSEISGASGNGSCYLSPTLAEANAFMKVPWASVERLSPKAGVCTHQNLRRVMPE
jgi:hypothetical protein